MENKYDVAAYIWPAYTGDEPRTKIFWPEGMGEWQSVKNAEKRFENHSWPRRPLWGYVNEADPNVMGMEIETALNYGVNVFIYDWYWYDERPFLENCLNEGFLKASNNEQMKFYLMWANHDVNLTWDKRLSADQNTVIWRGAVCRNAFERICKRVIDKYFSKKNYYCIAQKPVFQIYDIDNLVLGLGGVRETLEALSWFRKEVKEAGFPGVYLMLTAYGNTANLSGVDGEKTNRDFGKLYQAFDGMTHYQFVHYTEIDREYSDILKDVTREWEKLERVDLPYYPHISVGWDNNPRFQNFRGGIVRGNSPSEVEKGLRLAKQYADERPMQAKLITINSWNEWTETSYLQPDDLYRYGYLEAIRRVFGGRKQ